LFTVLLSNPSYLPVTLNFATSNDTAIAGIDYVATSGQLTFAPGETQKSIAIPVINCSARRLDRTKQHDDLHAHD